MRRKSICKFYLSTEKFLGSAFIYIILFQRCGAYMLRFLSDYMNSLLEITELFEFTFRFAYYFLHCYEVCTSHIRIYMQRLIQFIYTRMFTG